MKKPSLLYSLSLIYCGIVGLLFSISNIIGFTLPRVLMIILAVIDVAAIVFLLFGLIKMLREKE